MIVSHFNSFLRGGAATAAQQLHQSLLQNGVQSRFQHLAGQTFGDPTTVSLDRREYYGTNWESPGKLTKLWNGIRFRIHRERFKRATRGAGVGAEIFTSPHGRPSTPWPPLDHPARQNAGTGHIIHLHWISKFIDVRSFFASLPPGQPVVWTLHDMNALTGGCHFAGECQRFRVGCGNCPQLYRPGQADLSFRSFETKRLAMQNANLHVVAPSRWLLGLAQSSPLTSAAVSFHHIPYGMPTDQLYPMERQLARESLGIPNDAFIVCFGAMNLASRRKGAAELSIALQRVAAKTNIRCLVFGGGGAGDTSGAVASFPNPIPVGRIEDERKRRLVYSAADVFVLPSTEDNLPLTGLEAMACGTPVVAFDAGGVPDYVLPGRTGWLARKGDSDQLADQLLAAAGSPAKRKVMGRNARELILDQFQSERQAQCYLDLYRDVLRSESQPNRRAA